MRMVERVARMACKLLGHKPVHGRLKRSPYTAYTHYQDICCKRCGKYLTYKQHFFDAITQPEFFRSDCTKALEDGE